MNDTERIALLLRHINNVRNNCQIVADKLMTDGKFDLARQLIANAQIHDHSKFSGIEWQFLSDPTSTNKAGLKYAIEHHDKVNPHHPQYYTNGIGEMPEVYLIEFCCDVKARSMEFGTDLRKWIDDEATKKFKFTKDSEVYKRIAYYVDILCPKPFEPIESLEPSNLVSMTIITD